MNFNRLISLTIFFAASAVCGAEKVDFVKEIQPIFSEHCTSCHGGVKQQGGLSFLSESRAKGETDSGAHAVVEGSLEKSELVYRVTSDDQDIVMPPEGDPLSAEEIAKLTQWIQEGADWPAHWAFQPVELPKAPSVKDKGWAKTPIDHFILAKLEEEKIAPSPEADRVTLLRRLSLDLIGLLPTPEEVARFVADRSDDALEKQVDRLLASQHFGERWGRHWLDHARYADSDGYEKDNARPAAYIYRDWVIKAVNDDMPFDQFTREQLAGDLLPEATPMQKLATAFHAQTLINTEGGIDKEEDRNKRIMDRLSTTALTWMGLTLKCTQCHDHPYDPFTHEEYYRFLDFFNNSDEAKVDINRFLNTLDPAILKKAEAKIARAYETRPQRRNQWIEASRELIRSSGVISQHPLRSANIRSKHEATFTQKEDGSWFVTKSPQPTDDYIVTGRSDVKQISGIRLHLLSDPSLPHQGPGLASNGNMVLSRIIVKVFNKAKNHRKDVFIASASADFNQKDWSVDEALKSDKNSGWGIMGEIGKSHFADFTFAKPVTLGEDERFVITLRQEYAGHLIGRLKLNLLTGSMLNLPNDLIELLTQEKPLGGKEKKKLQEYHASKIDTVVSKAKEARDKVLASRNQVSDVIAERSKDRRDTYLFTRGNFLTPDKERGTMKAATQEVLPAFEPADLGQANRLDLANWLVAGTNPLTPRVRVNLIWMHLFGEGIVRTIDDFGTRAELPSHPQLLDWLAVSFRDNGWSRKALIKQIVMSSVYSQSSVYRPELLTRDPENKFLYRQNRLRVEGEIIRDITLQVSGLLNTQIGGQSVYPPLAPEVVALAYGSFKWNASKGKEKYRRGMYTFFKRSVPHPNLMTFDCPDSNATMVKRGQSNTPLQALVTLQNQTFIEASKAFGLRLAGLAMKPDSKIIDYGFNLALGRKARTIEQTALQQVLNAGRKYYAKNENEAVKLAGIQLPDGLETNEVAAWIATARVITNMDAFIMRE